MGTSTGNTYTASCLDIKDRILDLGLNSNLDPNTKAGMARINMEFKEQITNGHKKELRQLNE
jgi:hypothetical protein